jgi:hypothetical protein
MPSPQTPTNRSVQDTGKRGLDGGSGHRSGSPSTVCLIRIEPEFRLGGVGID